MACSLMYGMLRPPTNWMTDQCPDAIASTQAHREWVAWRLAQVADRLQAVNSNLSETAQPPHKIPAEQQDKELIACFQRASKLGVDQVIDVRWQIGWNELLSYIDDDITRAVPELDQVTAANRPGAWLRWSLPKAKPARQSSRIA